MVRLSKSAIERRHRYAKASYARTTRALLIIDLHERFLRRVMMEVVPPSIPPPPSTLPCGMGGLMGNVKPEDIAGLDVEALSTVLAITGALYKFIRGSGDTAVQQEAMYEVAEEAKRVLDRKKFPGEDQG